MARKKNISTAAKKPRRPKSPDPMPSLMFNGGTFEPNVENETTYEPQPLIEKKSFLNNYEQLIQREQNGRRWLWIGVISFMVIMGAIWIFSLKFQISNYHYQGSAEQLFIEENKTNWNTVFAEPPTTSTTTTPKQKIKEVLTLILKNASSTQTTSTSSIRTPTTTIP